MVFGGQFPEMPGTMQRISEKVPGELSSCQKLQNIQGNSKLQNQTQRDQILELPKRYKI